MEGRVPRLEIATEQESQHMFSYLSPVSKRSCTVHHTERISFTKNGFSSPKCVRASHEMFISISKIYPRRNSNNDSSKSILINNRKIGEKLLLDSFPTKKVQDK